MGKILSIRNQELYYCNSNSEYANTSSVNPSCEVLITEWFKFIIKLQCYEQSICFLIFLKAF